MTRLLERGAPPDAIFCVNDVLALGTMDGARARGMRVDLWMVGNDDIPIASWGAYDLTTVRQLRSSTARQAPPWWNAQGQPQR